ncbi:MAG: DUF3363 domain-containing protein [Pannonibacter sp.]
MAHLARHGQPRTFNRRRFAPWSIAARGRGNGAAATANLWADASHRRVFVRTTIGLAQGKNTAAFSAHIKYIQRDGTERDGSPAKPFDRETEDASARAFDRRSREDSHQFRVLVSPEDASQLEDLTAFTRKLMRQVDRDLGGPVDWMAACHFNTGQPHVHIIIRGGNVRDGERFIARKYITHGLRYRAENLVTQELGNRTWRDLSISRNQEIYSERFTSIDRRLELAARDGRYRATPEAAVPAGQFDGISNLQRLRHLKKLGLAEHLHGADWHFTEGWSDTLKSISPRTAALNEVSRALGARLDLSRAEEPTAGTVGGWITGRLAAVIERGAASSGPMILVEGLDGRTWMLHVPAPDQADLPERGAVISAYIPAMRPEQALARRPGAEEDATGPALAVPNLSVNSWLPVEALARRRAYTWLDELGADAVQTFSTGFGAEVRAAWQARQTFLSAERLDLVSREDLQAGELGDVAAAEARRLGKRYVALAQREVFRGVYEKDIDTAQGRFALIVGESRFTLIAPTGDMAAHRRQAVNVERSPLFRAAGGRSLEW